MCNSKRVNVTNSYTIYVLFSNNNNNNNNNNASISVAQNRLSLYSIYVYFVTGLQAVSTLHCFDGWQERCAVSELSAFVAVLKAPLGDFWVILESSCLHILDVFIIFVWISEFTRTRRTCLRWWHHCVSSTFRFNHVLFYKLIASLPDFHASLSVVKTILRLYDSATKTPNFPVFSIIHKVVLGYVTLWLQVWNQLNWYSRPK